jgi:hypothetical protein
MPFPVDIFLSLQRLYTKALAINSAIPHPRIMGIIHECGGKMHMVERHWAEAATNFFEFIYRRLFTTLQMRKVLIMSNTG